MVVTNNHERYLQCFCELPKKWQEEFDYMLDEERVAAKYIPRFVEYKKWWYDIHDMEIVDVRVPSRSTLGAWDVYASQSYSDGILIRVTKDSEKCVVGHYYYQNEA